MAASSFLDLATQGQLNDRLAVHLKYSDSNQDQRTRQQMIGAGHLTNGDIGITTATPYADSTAPASRATRVVALDHLGPGNHRMIRHPRLLQRVRQFVNRRPQPEAQTLTCCDWCRNSGWSGRARRREQHQHQG